ncbi:MAG: intradiol ring-cleavage dioxygenase [Gammaproteobacteria bacterium]|nr:intradiol ring-cleavage dioxygenase [Gammaproteobacteria bacterium]
MAQSRRQFGRTLLGLAAGLASGGVLGLGVPAATPRQPAGPFYPDVPILDDDNDLTRVAGQTAQALGAVSDLEGRILDRNGVPIADARVEIWQCDANGRYRHSRDPGEARLDPGFQGFGHNMTDSGGRYRFRTIRPVPYPGRTPHIHVAVFVDDGAPFVTQLYVAGEPRNDADFLYRRIPVERRERVTAEFAESATPGVAYSARWDMVLGEV